MRPLCSLFLCLESSFLHSLPGYFLLIFRVKSRDISWKKLSLAPPRRSAPSTLELNVRRQGLFDLLQLGLDSLDDGHRVGSGLLLDQERDGVSAVEAGQGSRFLFAVQRGADVSNPDGGALVIGDDQVAEIRGSFDPSQCSESLLPCL